MASLVRRRWIWRFDQPPERMWPLLSDTARFNEAMKTPKYQMEEIPQADGTILRLARTRFGRVELEWEERPYEWVENRRFTQTRLFRKGPFRRFGPVFRIDADDAGSRASYELVVEPANSFGRLLLLFGFMARAGKMVDRLVRRAARHASGIESQVFDYRPPPLPAGAAARLDAMVARLEAGPYAHGLARRLADHVTNAQEVDLMRLRPKALASAWGVQERDVIELALAAVREGLLDLRWDLLCPRCRGAKATAGSLDRLPTGAHCPSCNIDYGRDFARNVELTFHPAAAIRPIAGGEYCLSGPGGTPHVKVQQILAPGEVREVEAMLPAGDYRLRTLEPSRETDIAYDGGPFPELVASPEGVAAGSPSLPGIIRFRNEAGREATFVIESRDWIREALTAHQVTTLQSFRDLFADQVLRPGDEVGIERVTLMFSDLKGSTALYERVGDAGAYRLVREHFAFLAETVRRHDGAIVKTIGDAVMAAFGDPAKAVRAAIAIQSRVEGFNARHGPESIAIKLGLHQGPCIAVTLNDRLDYFGTTVNLAARLQGESRGGDIVISEALAADPVVATLLAPLGARHESAEVRGFAQPVPFRRILAAVPSRLAARS